MAITLKFEAPSQRRHLRITVPIQIAIDGATYKVVDWSIAGFKILGFAGNVQANEVINVYVKVPFQGVDVGFAAKARLLRYAPDSGELVGFFENLGERELATLQNFAQGLVSGEMEEVDGMLRRLDTPVTPASLKPKQVPGREADIKRQRGIRIYGWAALLLTVLLICVLYGSFFQLKVTTAIAMGQNEVVLSPATAQVAFVAEVNKPLKKGDPIVTLIDPKLEDDIHAAELRVQTVSAERDRLAASLKIEGKRMSAASNMMSAQTSASRATLSSLKKNLAVKQASMDRTKKLVEQGYASQLALERAQSEYLDVEHQYNEAKREASGLEAAASTVKSGFQVQNQLVSSGSEDIEAMRNAALENVAAANAQLGFLLTQRERMNIKAPEDGKLVRQFTPKNGSAKYGEPVAIFEHNGKRAVQAFLTQQEALHVSQGQSAKVYVGNKWASVPHKVTDIDFYTLALGQTQGRIQWQNYLTDNFKTVIVTLEPADEEAAAQMQNFPAGSASTVVFPLW